jgi:alanine-synthesizing transaminase
VAADFRLKGVSDVATSDVFIGNGVSELIMMSIQALVNSGDEVLVPAPDYPLWTAAVNLAGGRAVHYLCNEASGWEVDLNDLRSKVSARTKAIVVINPNNPTGAVYGKETLEGIAAIAAEHNLVVYADEIYGRITYDGALHIPFATVDPRIVTVCFDGLSKAWQSCGYRAGWMAVAGGKKAAADYLDGIATLSSLRLCANMPAQFAIQAALTAGERDLNALLLPGGRLKEQRDITVQMINAIPGLSTVMPQGALYCFPKIDVKRYNILSDEIFVMDLLKSRQLLLIHGTGFNWKEPDHFRIVFLPDKDTIADALQRLGAFLEQYRQE